MAHLLCVSASSSYPFRIYHDLHTGLRFAMPRCIHSRFFNRWKKSRSLVSKCIRVLLIALLLKVTRICFVLVAQKKSRSGTFFGRIHMQLFFGVLM